MSGISENTLTLTRAPKIVFDEARVALSDFLAVFWPEVKTYDTTEIPADTLTPSHRLGRYRELNGASNILTYKSGKGVVYNPASIDESTPITEKLAQAVTAGLEASSPAQQQIMEKIAQIRAQHDDVLTSAIVKQGMDIFVKGTFQPVGKGGVDIGGEFDFGRDPANTITDTYAANPVKQLTDAYDQYKKKYGPSVQLFAIIGADILGRLEANADFQAALKLQGVNAGFSRLVGDSRVIADIIPGGFKIPKRSARVNLLAFDEAYEDEDGTQKPFMDPKGIIFSSFAARRVQAYGGVYLVNTQTGSAQVVAGTQVSDAFWTKNPDAYILRSQTRPILVPGNIDHTVYVLSSD